MEVIAKRDFTLKGILYKKGEQIHPPKEYLIKLNEQGFIEPIDIKNIDEYDNKIKKNSKKESDINV